MSATEQRRRETCQFCGTVPNDDEPRACSSAKQALTPTDTWPDGCPWLSRADKVALISKLTALRFDTPMQGPAGGEPSAWDIEPTAEEIERELDIFREIGGSVPRSAIETALREQKRRRLSHPPTPAQSVPADVAGAYEDAASIAETDIRSDLAKDLNYEPEFHRAGKRIAAAIRQRSQSITGLSPQPQPAPDQGVVPEDTARFFAKTGWRFGMAAARSDLAITHDDLCRLSRVFCDVTGPTSSTDVRINEWLKKQIASAASAPQPAPDRGVVVPEGWMLAPIEPTQTMLDAHLGLNKSRIPEPMYESRRDLRPLIYRAMLSAAPPVRPSSDGERG